MSPEPEGNLGKVQEIAASGKPILSEDTVAQLEAVGIDAGKQADLIRQAILDNRPVVGDIRLEDGEQG